MAKGDLLVRVADKETLDAVKADTTDILGKIENSLAPKRYGVKINKLDSNPDTRIEYIYDAAGMKPAKMNFAQGTFDYGDWADVFFVKNNYPAMVKYDGTEDYRLNKNDQGLKEDGTPSDIGNVDYPGNAMAVFDGSEGKGKIWLSQYEKGNYEYIIISDVKYDESYNDFAYVRENGTHADKLYYPMFAGSYDGTRLRSIAEQDTYNGANAATEVERAKANGKGWDIGSWSKRNLLNCLLTVISKSDNSQEAFGHGDANTYVDDALQNYGHIKTGTLKNKGQFFGFNDDKHEVKVFFMETWWGNSHQRIHGLINAKGKLMAKMTPPYNFEGTGYQDTGIAYVGSTSGYQKDTKMSIFGRLPVNNGGSSNTYTCDYVWWNDTYTCVALVGGYCTNGSYCGASCVALICTAGSAIWSIGASVFLEQPNVA